MELQRVEKATSAAQMGNVLARTFDRLDSIGRGDLLADARVYFDRAEELRAARLDAPDRFDVDRRAVLDDLVSREIEPLQAIERMAVISRVADQRGAIPSLLKDASDRATALSWNAVRSHGDGLVTDLHDMIRELIEESVKSAESIPAKVKNDETAVEAGTEVASAWALLKRQYQAWCAIHETVEELRVNGALPHVEQGWPTYLGNEYRYRYPDPIDPWHFRDVPSPLHIAEAARLGAKPGIYTVHDVRTFRAERERLPRAATA
jgi:hypothetical protein